MKEGVQGLEDVPSMLVHVLHERVMKEGGALHAVLSDDILAHINSRIAVWHLCFFNPGHSLILL